MAEGAAAVRAGEHVAEGIVAKAARDVLRDAEGNVVRSAERTAAHDAEHVAVRDAEQTAERTIDKAAGKSGERSAERDVAGAGRRQGYRNESGLPEGPGTSEGRRAYDKAHGTEPNWGDLTDSYHGPAPDDMTRPHGHHIVYKEGMPGKVRDIVDQSKDILERNDIDWYTGRENLIWAPNAGHSAANAQRVLDALRAVDGQGREAVLEALRNAGRTVFGGRP